MRLVKILRDFCKQRDTTIENMLEPQTEKDLDTRDAFLSFARFVHGARVDDLAELLDLKHGYIMGVIKQ